MLIYELFYQLIDLLVWSNFRPNLRNHVPTDPTAIPTGISPSFPNHLRRILKKVYLGRAVSRVAATGAVSGFKRLKARERGWDALEIGEARK